MAKIVYALVMCLVISACDQSPQAIERRKIDQIMKEQKRESEDFDKLVKQNANMIREIKDRVASDMIRGRGGQTEQVNRSNANPNAEVGPSRLYRNRVAKFSVEFPGGWEVQETSAKTGAIIASNSENGSSLKISREDNDDNSPLTLDKAKMVGENFYSQIQQHDPSARMTDANIIRNFNGHEAIFTVYRLSSSKVISFTVVPYKKYAYVIGFEGPQDAFREVVGSSMFSFKIL